MKLVRLLVQIAAENTTVTILHFTTASNVLLELHGLEASTKSLQSTHTLYYYLQCIFPSQIVKSRISITNKW